jgi:hypothetical protein
MLCGAGLCPLLIVPLAEVGRTQIAVGDSRVCPILQRHLIGFFRLLIFALSVVDGSEIVERVRVSRIESKRSLVILTSLFQGEEMMICDPHLVPDGGGLKRALSIGLDRSDIVSVIHLGTRYSGPVNVLQKCLIKSEFGARYYR